jgi:hypothetical protein
MRLGRVALLLSASIGLIVGSTIALAARNIAIAAATKTNLAASAQAVAGSSKGHAEVAPPAGNGDISWFVLGSGSPLNPALDTAVFNGATLRPLFIRHVPDGTFASMRSAIAAIRGEGRDAEPLTFYARDSSLRTIFDDLSDKPEGAALVRIAAAAFARDRLDASAGLVAPIVPTGNIWGIDDSPTFGPSTVVLIRITQYGYIQRYGEHIIPPTMRPELRLTRFGGPWH